MLTMLITVSLISRIPVIAADIIALTAAWRKAVGVVRDASRCNIRVPLSDVLIRDGEPLPIFYFITLISSYVGSVLFL